MLQLVPLIITRTEKGVKNAIRTESAVVGNTALNARKRTSYTVSPSIKMDPSCSYAKRRHNSSRDPSLSSMEIT